MLCEVVLASQAEPHLLPFFSVPLHLSFPSLTSFQTAKRKRKPNSYFLFYFERIRKNQQKKNRYPFGRSGSEFRWIKAVAFQHLPFPLFLSNRICETRGGVIPRGRAVKNASVELSRKERKLGRWMNIDVITETANIR